MRKTVSLVNPGVSDGDAQTVRFNALGITEDDRTEATFVLEIGDALRLGRELADSAERTIAQERESQKEAVRNIESSRPKRL
jgi:hypothetical protein